MIEVSDHPTIVLTDHAATAGIVRQTSLTSSSVDHLNRRLIRASQYLSQFNLEVLHVKGREYLVPDALSRLSAADTTNVDNKDDILDDLVISN